ALGSGLAGLGGALGIEIVGLDPNFAFKYLVYMLIVVAVGGLASIRGAFVTAAMLGIIDIVSKYYVPEIGAFVLYFVMVSFLVWRPAGLFVRRS
ncbi:MAG TPA: branched-chain amino acid ABC transporter permease, partial [Xanthobacteraceae bacterium]